MGVAVTRLAEVIGHNFSIGLCIYFHYTIKQGLIFQMDPTEQSQGVH